MDIKKIIDEKVNALADNGDIQKAIEDNIEKSVKNAIGDLFHSYDFRSSIKKKLEDEIDPLLKEIDLSAHKKIIHARALETIRGVMDEELSKKAIEQYNLLFSNKVEKIKMSEIFEMVRKNFTEDDAFCQRCDNENFHFEFDYEKKEDDGFTRLKISFDKNSDCGRNPNYYFYLLKYKEDNFKISQICLEYKPVQKDKLALFQPGYLNDFERVLLIAYFNETPIEVDIDEDDIDTSLFDRDY